jgi:Rha family phage regulatory protein
MSTNHSYVVPVVSVVNNQPITTSLNVAEVFGKRHDHVLATIRDIDVPEAFLLPNFREISYKDSYDRDQVAYHLTRDGFTILVMGFTGRRAMQWKIAYIDAFNRMEAALLEKAGRPGDGDSPRIPAEVWARVRKNHHGIKLALRVRLLDIVCRMSQLDEGPRNKAVIFSDYADLCEAMREGANLPALAGGLADPDLARFFEAECMFGGELVVSKADLYAAYERFAQEEGDAVHPRPVFFKAIRSHAPVRDLRTKYQDDTRTRCLRGVSLADTSAAEVRAVQ